MVTPSPTPVRMPEELKAWLQQRASANLRSLNSEIVTVLLAEKKRCDKRRK